MKFFHFSFLVTRVVQFFSIHFLHFAKIYITVLKTTTLNTRFFLSYSKIFKGHRLTPKLSNSIPSTFWDTYQISWRKTEWFRRLLRSSCFKSHILIAFLIRIALVFFFWRLFCKLQLFHRWKIPKGFLAVCFSQHLSYNYSVFVPVVF